MAVFYRTNAQSRALETALADRGIAYTVIGGTRFFDRREIRDVLAYLRAVANPGDEVSLRRILNMPRRGIGDTTVGAPDRLRHRAGRRLRRRRSSTPTRRERRARPWRGCAASSTCSTSSAPASSPRGPPDQLIEVLLERTGYRDMLEAEIAIGGSRAIDAEGRVENLAELMNVASEHENLESFLESTALVAATDVARRRRRASRS